MIEYSQKIVGSQIRKYRLAKKLSLKQLETLTGISASYIRDLEHGGRTKNSSVSMKKICKIAEILGVSLDDLAFTNIEYRQNLKNKDIISNIANEIISLSLEDLIILDGAIDIFGSNSIEK